MPHPSPWSQGKLEPALRSGGIYSGPQQTGLYSLSNSPESFRIPLGPPSQPHPHKGIPQPSTPKPPVQGPPVASSSANTHPDQPLVGNHAGSNRLAVPIPPPQHPPGSGSCCQDSSTLHCPAREQTLPPGTSSGHPTKLAPTKRPRRRRGDKQPEKSTPRKNNAAF